MKHNFSIAKAYIFLEFFIALGLLLMVKDVNSMNSFNKLTILLLEFVIILELVRMLIDFLLSEDNQVKMRLMIDSTIVFFIRDIMLIINDKFDIVKIVSLLAVIAVLFIFRIISLKYSPTKLEKE
jgi:uncharacterized membrane protein (DUF373 family)